MQWIIAYVDPTPQHKLEVHVPWDPELITHWERCQPRGLQSQGSIASLILGYIPFDTLSTQYQNHNLIETHVLAGFPFPCNFQDDQTSHILV